jgi:hypothetical protein
MKILYKILGFTGALAGLMLAFAATASAATLAVSPSSQTLNVGDTLTVQILLDTQGQPIDGLDVNALNYNPYFLQIEDADASTDGTQIQPGNLMANTLANSVDTVNGKILFSQVTTPGSTYTGSGVLATVTFKALVAGTAKLTFDFVPGSTTNSDVASAGNNILTAVTNGQYTINNVATSVSGNSGGGGNSGSNGLGGLDVPGAGSGSGSALRLIDNNGTYYLVINNVLHGITNPGMLYTYGFTFAMGKPATSADMALEQGSLLTPQDGALVKSQQDPTVYLISGQQRYGFVSAKVFTALGFKFSSVLVVTNPELQALPRAANLSSGTAQHLPGLDIKENGTVYWVGSDNMLHGYPSLDVYNSWHLPNDFSRVVPANAADMALPMGDLVSARVLQ